MVLLELDDLCKRNPDHLMQFRNLCFMVNNSFMAGIGRFRNVFTAYGRTRGRRAIHRRGWLWCVRAALSASAAALASLSVAHCPTMCRMHHWPSRSRDSWLTIRRLHLGNRVRRCSARTWHDPALLCFKDRLHQRREADRLAASSGAAPRGLRPGGAPRSRAPQPRRPRKSPGHEPNAE